MIMLLCHSALRHIPDFVNLLFTVVFLILYIFLSGDKLVTQNGYVFYTDDYFLNTTYASNYNPKKYYGSN